MFLFFSNHVNIKSFWISVETKSYKSNGSNRYMIFKGMSHSSGKDIL